MNTTALILSIFSAAAAPAAISEVRAETCGAARIYKAGAIVFGNVPAAFTAVLPEGTASEKAQGIFEAAVQELLEAVNQPFSLYVADSEIVRFNRHPAGQPFAASDEFYELLVRSRYFFDVSGGAFDPTVKPVIDLYRRLRKGEKVAAGEYEAARALVGMNQLAFLPENGILKKEPGIAVDLGGIAKGYGVERAVALMRARGVSAGIVELGGDLKVFGGKPDGSGWGIGVIDPLRPRSIAAVLTIPAGADVAVVTSGDYERKYEVGGKEYTHIVDPRAGKPLEYRGRGVTIVMPDAVAADALATACFVLSADEAMRLAEEQAAGIMFVSGKPDGDLEFSMNSQMERFVTAVRRVAH